MSDMLNYTCNYKLVLIRNRPTHCDVTTRKCIDKTFTGRSDCILEVPGGGGGGASSYQVYPDVFVDD